MKKTERQAIAEAIRKSAEVLRSHTRIHSIRGGSYVVGWTSGNLESLAWAVEHANALALEGAIARIEPKEIPEEEDRGQTDHQ